MAGGASEAFTEERLIEQISNIGVEKVNLTGYLKHDTELPGVFSRAYCLLPAFSYNRGLSYGCN